MKKTVVLFLLLVALFPAWGQAIDPSIAKETITFGEKDGQVLKFDKYRMAGVDEVQPCMFFVFGGSFMVGERDKVEYFDYFQFLVKEGYTVISIDYRLGMAGKKEPGIWNNGQLRKAIAMAVDDLVDATAYALKRADEWKIDKNRILISGSSAGAVTVLQTVYEHRNNYPSTAVLPDDFSYAGVISFAGAIFSTKGGLKWEETPCPMMIFHGQDDQVVPYKGIRLLWLNFAGSAKVAKSLEKINSPYWFLSYEEMGHEVAVDMMNYQTEIAEFLNTYIKEAKPRREESYINEKLSPIQ